MVPSPQARDPLVFILSGLSGAGKDSVMDGLRALEPDIYYCITATTRLPRPGERHGVHHYFLGREEFVRLKESDGLLESAVVYDQLYGTPCAQVREALSRGQDVLARVDVQGAMSIRARIPAAVLIFLAAGHLKDLRARLEARGTEGDEDIALRLATAEKELEFVRDFDYLVHNLEGRLEEAVEQVRGIIRAERMRVVPRRATLDGPCGGA